MELEVVCFTDVKTAATTPMKVEVEVGVAGMYDTFMCLGGRGKRVISGDAAAATHGVVINVKLDRNPKAWEYRDFEWQKFAGQCAVRHVEKALMGPHDPTKLTTQISVTLFSVEALTPITSGALMSKMSSRGVRVHLLVKGVYFGAQAVAGLMPAEPIPLVGRFPSGEVAEGGLRPLKADVPCRVTVPRVMKEAKNFNGSFYAPSALAAHPRAAAEGGNMQTQRRSEMRRLARVARWADREEGEIPESKKQKARQSPYQYGAPAAGGSSSAGAAASSSSRPGMGGMGMD